MIELTLNIPEREAADELRRMTFESIGFHRRPGVAKVVQEEFENTFRAGGYSLSGRANAWTDNSREWTEKKRREGRSTRKLVYTGKLFRAAIRPGLKSRGDRLRIEWSSQSGGFDVATHWQHERRTFRKIVAHPELVRRLSDEFLQAVLEVLAKHGWVIGAGERKAA